MIRLLEKSNKNFEAANWAEKKEYYDVAVSRLYYSNFQKLKYYLVKILQMDNCISKKSHEDFFKFLQSHIERFGDKDVSVVTHLFTMKGKRKIADYESVIVCSKQTQYEKIKTTALLINEYLDKYI